MEACKRSTQKQKQRVEEQQLGLTVVLPPLIFSLRPSIPYFLSPKGNRRGSSSECLLHYTPNDIYPPRLSVCESHRLHSKEKPAPDLPSPYQARRKPTGYRGVHHDGSPRNQSQDSYATPLSSKCLQKMLKRRKDLPQRRMPVIIFIIPLPSAEMSLSRYSLRSKYIISLKIFVSGHVFLQQKYTSYLTTPNISIDLTLQKHKKGHDCSCP